MDDLDEQRRALTRRYVARAAERAAVDPEQALASADERESLRRVAHDLKGTGGAYGFPDISETAAALELFLTSCAADEAPVPELLDPLLAALQGAIEAAAAALETA